MYDFNLVSSSGATSASWSVATSTLTDLNLEPYIPGFDCGTPKRVDNGTCESDGGFPGASINWASYDNDQFYLTASSLSVDEMMFNLSAPAVNVQKFDLARQHSGNNSIPRWYKDTRTGLVVNSTLLRTNTICRPKQTYQWGFSALILFTFSIVTTIFGFLLFLLSGGGKRRHRGVGPPTYFSVYRDILDLALEIKKELGDSAEALSARELDKRITTATGAVRVEEDSFLTSLLEEHNKPLSLVNDVDSEPSSNLLRRLYPSRRPGGPRETGGLPDGDDTAAIAGSVRTNESDAASTAYQGGGEQLMMSGSISDTDSHSGGRRRVLFG